MGRRAHSARPESPHRSENVFLLFDPYTNRQWSMGDLRVVNRVADTLINAHEHLDPSEIAGAIRQVYRPGMEARPLLQHARRRLRGEPEQA